MRATSRSCSSAASICRRSSRSSSDISAACRRSIARRPARDVGIRPPAGVVEKEVTKGTTPKSEVGVVFTGPFQNNQRNRIIIRAMANTLAGNLQRVLREDLGGTYGVSVDARVHEAADRGVPADDHIRLRSRRARRISSRRCSRSSRSSRPNGPERRAGRGRAGGAAARSRNRQPAERVRLESAGVRVSVRRAGSRSRHAARRSTISCRRRCCVTRRGHIWIPSGM